MIVDIPLDYQPLVGETISVTLTGRVNAISIDPMATNCVVVTLETQDNEEAEYVGPGQQRKHDVTVGVNGFAGSTF